MIYFSPFFFLSLLFQVPKEIVIGNTSATMGFEPDCISKWIHHMHTSKSTGIPQHFDFIAGHSGRTIWGLCTVFPLPDNTSGLPLYAYIVNDITEQKLFVIEQERARNSLEAMLRNMNGAVWETEIESEDPAFTFVSPALNTLLDTVTVKLGDRSRTVEEQVSSPQKRPLQPLLPASSTGTCSASSASSAASLTSPSVTTAFTTAAPTTLKSSADGSSVMATFEEIKGRGTPDDPPALAQSSASPSPSPSPSSPSTEALGCAGFFDLHTPRLSEVYEFNKVYDFPLRDLSGETRWLRNSVRYTKEGGTAKKVGILLDVSKEKEVLRLQSEMREIQTKQKIKTDFFTNMSHEIRTPLNGIIGLGQLLMDTALNGEQQEYTSSLVDCANSLLSLINDVLDLSKIEANKMTLNVTTFDLARLVEEATQIVAIKAHEKDIELLVNYDVTMRRRIVGDPARVRQVLINLLGNAVKFTGSNGQIIVSVETDESALKILVSDNGIGIPKEKLHAIFDRFEQAEGSTASKYGGYGLGLDICKSIVKFLGGTIGVESELGRGSTFWFSLPLITESSSSSDSIFEEEFALAQTPFLSEHKVLIVDQSRKYCEITAKIIASWDIEAQFCTAVDNAVEQLEKKGCYNGIRYDAYIITCWGDGFTRKIGEITRRFNLKVIRVIHLGRTFPKNEEGELILKPLSSGRLQGSLRRLLLNSGSKRLPPPPSSSSSAKGALVAIAQEAASAARPEDFTGQDTDKMQSPPPSTSKDSSPARGEKRPLDVATGSRISEKQKKSQISVLLVDDDKVNQMVGSKFLQSLGCTVTVADNGLKAVQEVREREFNLIFMDCQMPEMDGFEACVRIRQEEERLGRKRTPMIALTGSSHQEALQKCYETGMDDFVTKPIGKNDFSTLISKHTAVAVAVENVVS